MKRVLAGSLRYTSINGGRENSRTFGVEDPKTSQMNFIWAERLKGFMMASWTDCKNEGSFRFNCAGMDQLADTMSN